MSDETHGHADEPLSLRVVRRVEDLEGLRAAWTDLLARLPGASIFSTPEWLLPWHAAYGNGCEPHVIEFRDQENQLVGLAPLMVRSRTRAGKKLTVLQLLGDGSGDSENLDIPIVQGKEHSVVSALLDHLMSTRRCWDIAELNTLPGDSVAAREVAAQLRTRRWPLETSTSPCCAIPLPRSWDQYTKGSLSKKERFKVRYLTKRLEGTYEVSYERCTDPDLLHERLEQLRQLHTARWRTRGLGGAFALPERVDFYRRLSPQLLKTDALEFWSLALDGKPVAMQYGFRYRNIAYALQEGFDPDLDRHSPGYVLRAHVLRHLIESGARKYDFLGGLSDAKARWGAIPAEYVHLRFAYPATTGAWFLRASVAARELKRFIRDNAPRPVTELLRRLSRVVA